ncbi:12174_t:CDS:2, partial [Entrophospora sp. SA101]
MAIIAQALDYFKVFEKKIEFFKDPVKYFVLEVIQTKNELKISMKKYWNIWNMEILKKKQKISTISNWITRTYV